jgi:hypothetical protein
MTTEIDVQGVVHKLEEGAWKKWVLFALRLAAIGFVLQRLFFGDNGFKGLVHPHAMEQAEIAREMARGHGFSTKMVRPAAIWFFEQHTGSFPADHIPDIYHAPLWPITLTPFLWIARDAWEMSEKDVVYTCDKVVAAASSLFFLLAVAANYFLARRLFDARMAQFVTLLMLVCDRFWQYAISGLPQMMMLFLLTCAAYTLLRAVEAQIAQEPKPAEDSNELEEEISSRGVADFDSSLAAKASDQAIRSGWLASPIPWLAATAAIFGLLALTHGLTCWIFLGTLAFCAFFFRRIGITLGMMVGIFVLVYSPWLVRNYTVAHGFKGITGLAAYSAWDGLHGSESQIMRTLDEPIGGLGVRAFAEKLIQQSHLQLGSLYSYLGYCAVAPVFFVSLLHVFRRREISVFRWAILLMWGGALLGMGLFGMDTQKLPSNDLHLLFAPLMTMYGLAFVLLLWSRLEFSHIRLIHIGFLTLLYVISGRPFIGTFVSLFQPSMYRVQWPPYVPSWILPLRVWTSEREVIMSDMPWAVAWYTDRESLWLPTSPENFNELNDYSRLGKGRPIVGLYLTPVSGDQPYLSGIEKGEYAKWAQLIKRTPQRNFPLHAMLGLPIEGECVVYFDRDRWTPRED